MYCPGVRAKVLGLELEVDGITAGAVAGGLAADRGTDPPMGVAAVVERDVLVLANNPPRDRLLRGTGVDLALDLVYG